MDVCEFGALCAEASNVVFIDTGTNDICNGCVPEELAEGIVAFAHKLTSIPFVLYAILCHYVVSNDFDEALQIVGDELVQIKYNSEHIVNGFFQSICNVSV